MIILGQLFLFLHKIRCCGYSLEAPPGLLINTHNIRIFGEMEKIITEL